MHSHHPPAGALPGGRPQDHLWATLVLVAGVAAYLPALAGAFIWNDADYVTSPALRSWAGLARIWTEFGATEQYYPLLHSAFWLQHRFWGDHAFGYHLVNVLAHAGGAVLFGVVLRQLAVPGAWLGAALFALHPVHVESVAWISEQKNTLSLLLYLAAAWAYLKFDDTRSRKFYALGLALFALSLLTKTVTATLPAALLVVLWWRRGTLAWRRDFRPLLPWLLLGAGAGLLTSWIERHYGGAVGDEFTVGWPERLLVAGRAFWFYVGSLVWPFNLNFIYPRWTPDARVVWQWLFPLAAVAVIAIGWLLRHRTRAPLAVLLFFAGSLFPVLGFVNLYGARYSWVWDHWQYLPDLGPLAFAGAGLALAARRFAPHTRIVRFATVALLASLAALTWSHSRIFRDDETLYRATLARNPDAWMAHANLGTLIGAQPERRDEAIRHLRAAAELKPDSAEVHESLANLLAHNPADHTAAREHYEIAIRLEPARATAHNNFGLLLSRRGETEAALACFRRALEHNPRLAFAAANLGSVLCATDRAAEALPVLEHALALDPALPATHLALGNTFRALSRHADAERAYREALRLDPAAVDIRLRLAELLLATEELPAAVTLLREAAAIVPADAEALYHLGHALLRSGDFPGGVRHLREAVRLRPAWATARLSLGNALARAGDFPGAIEEFRAALVAEPNNLRARNNLANALLLTGDPAGAVREYEASLQQQPDNQALRTNLEIAREKLRELRRSSPGR